MALFPLLGLLGAAGGIAAGPHLENRANRIRGDYASGLLADVDQSDPAAVNQALFGGGLLAADQFQGDLRTAFEGNLNRENALQRTRISSGPAYMNARLAQQKYQDQLAGIVPPMTPYQEAQVALGQERLAMERESVARDAAAVAAQQGLAAGQAYATEMEPLLATQAKYQRVADLMPDASRWTPQWLSDPANADARREAEQTLFELKQDWIQREISFGREPNSELYERADEMFPDSLGAFKSRSQLEEFIRTQQAEMRGLMERAGARYRGAMTNNPATLVDHMMDRNAGVVSAGEVIRD